MTRTNSAGFKGRKEGPFEDESLGRLYAEEEKVEED
jgi:hypothetical protein